MKQINLFRNLLFAALLSAAGIVHAQIHPLAFGSYTLGGGATASNWYADYVGLRFEVVSPTSDVGNKAYTYAFTGSVPWGGQVVTPIVNVPIEMPQAGDSCCSVLGTYDHTITTDMTGKIGFVYRGASIDFGDKALDCQNAGAVACVIVNNVPGAPLGMSEAYLSGAALGSVTIPVFMISQEDGHIIDSLYNAGTAAHITVTTWGQNLVNDLGFVPGGAALWHNYAIPSNQLLPDGNPASYNMVNGAFIANYGTAKATGVTLKTKTSFTPNGGIATVQHVDSTVFEGIFYDDDTVAHNASDSIMAMFSKVEYPLSASGTGRFDLFYQIKFDQTDQYPQDDTMTTSFYVTDSLYSKSTYDFVNNKPVASVYEGFNSGGEFMWGPMYYVANGGTAISAVQWSLAKDVTAGDPNFSSPANNIYVFKWTDTLGGSADSIIEDGELSIVGSASYTYNVNDTTGITLYSQIYDNSAAQDTGGIVYLEANSWYYVAIDVPSVPNTTSATGNQMFLGCDGVINPYPRVYGRYHADTSTNGTHLIDYSNLEYNFTPDSLSFYSGYGNFPVIGASTAFITSVDSFIYSNMIGLVPSVSMIANNNPPAEGVKNVSKTFANVSLFPNPAKNQLNVSVAFNENQKAVTYEIIDGLARFVSKETHNNVQNETYTLNTASLPSGNYFLIINGDNNKMVTKKFVVLK